MKLSKKIDRKYNADAVSYSASVKAAFTHGPLDLTKIDLSCFRDASDDQAINNVVCL